MNRWQRWKMKAEHEIWDNQHPGVTTRMRGYIPGCIPAGSSSVDYQDKVAHMPKEYQQGAIAELMALASAPAGLIGSSSHDLRTASS